MEQRTALFPGSFDPFTVGHESVVSRALNLFDKIVIAVGENSSKKHFYPLEKRVEWIRMIFENEPKVKVESYTGLTIQYCKEIGANYILRGLRTSADFEYERAVGQTNRILDSQIETVFLLTQPEHTFITSTIVRDVLKHGGDASKLLPQKVKNEISQYD
jgi:pantetheine-phosphate adenylyltransferase